MKLQMSFGENLINLRKQKGWSQDDLADNLNLSRQAISKWENDTSKPDIDNIKKISKIFSVTIDDLLNNDVVKDKAVTLNVKKKEKKERTITILKCMIIAVIILYIINVIFKFASLLIIVNGIQKYANLSNYHYIITTYDENGLVEQEECWFKEGVSKTIIKDNGIQEDKIEYIDFNNNYGFVENIETNIKMDINMTEYLEIYDNYDKGAQFFSRLPLKIRTINIISLINSCFVGKKNFVEIDSNSISISSNDVFIIMDKSNFFPMIVNTKNKKDNNEIIQIYKIELNNVQKVTI